MKRKLNEKDVPAPVEEEVAEDKTEGSEQETPQATSAPVPKSFDDFKLDARLLQAIAGKEFKYTNPTPAQALAIPHALEGRDVLLQAGTGTGKTAAYLLPVLQSLLRRKATSAKAARATSILVLVPTNELAAQVTKVARSFVAFCGKDVRAVNLNQKVADAVLGASLAELPDIVVGSPGRVNIFLGNSSLRLDSVQSIVLDEADTLITFNYESDLQSISKTLPGAKQTIMASATMSADVDAVKKLFCEDPVVLELKKSQDEEKAISQFVTECGEDDKFLYLYVIFKLKLVKGKCIIFVADIDRSYRLKLYLEQFGIRSCVLNSELPVNSRIHVVEEFSKNVYEILIASDEQEVLGNEGQDKKAEVDDAEQDGEVPAPAKKRKTSKKSKKNKDYGVSRGIDFKNVACVLNFDLPPTAKSYTHRIGRTGRAGRSGMALSFVVPSGQQGKHKPTSIASTANDEQVLSEIRKVQDKREQEVKEYAFDENVVDPFRYRMNDALRAVTGVAVREARTRELRQELINSEKLKRHFEENPEDLHHLRHDSELRAARVQSHLKHVPDYLMPNGGAQAGKDIGFVGFKKTTGGNRIREARLRNKAKGRGKTTRRDPLKTFSARPKK